MMIRDLLTVSQVLQDIAGVKVKNRQYACWLHSDRHPSGRVSRDDKRFKCFQCGVGGTIFDVVMLTLNVSFIEAKKYLYQYYNITPPETGGREAKLQLKRLREERELEAAFNEKVNSIYIDLAAMHRALFKYDDGSLEHISYALQELMNELMSNDPKRRVEAVRAAEKWWGC
ncbi:MAG: hypothetical protein K6T66_13115 [Peptococcaceae bacterium]|nr:hypothetical protein [Peptococcaceae bacterium]